MKSNAPQGRLIAANARFTTEPSTCRRVIAAAAAVVLLDQLSKALALAYVGTSGGMIGPVDLVVVRNRGGPFGIVGDRSVFWTVVAVIVLGLAIFVVFVKRVLLGPAIAVGAVLGGAFGNLVDRLVRAPGIARGAVVDWIAVDPYPRVFNLADVALRAGAVALVVAALIRGRRATVTRSRSVSMRVGR